VGSSVRVVDIGRDDWRELRALRLEMLRDTPMAYLETVPGAEALGSGEWAFRAARCGQPGCLGVAAVEEDTGQWVGTMSAHLAGPAVANLVTVYVAPAHRGTGLADLLLDSVLSWAARQDDVRTVALLVHEQNGRAAAFYARRGFRASGRTESYPLDPSQRELEMVLPIVG
jgi:GNAT superfamily N-acetyltransferase